MTIPQEIDILLVGAGPIGIEMGAELKQSGFRYLHIESGNIASTIEWYSPGTTIFSSPERIAVAGIPFTTYPAVKATREDYLNYLRGVVLGFNLEIYQGHRLVRVAREPDAFRCEIASSTCSVGGPDYVSLEQGCSSERQIVRCQKLILAIGDMHRSRRLGIPGEEAGEAYGNVTHFLPELHRLFRKRIVIVGAKNSSAEAVVRLARTNREIDVIHRGADYEAGRVKPWLLPEIRSLIAEGRVRFHAFSHVVNIEHHSVTLQNWKDSSRTAIPFDHLLLLTGYDQDPSLFEEIGLALSGECLQPVFDSNTMETSVKGVYVAGTAIAGSQRAGFKVFIENCHSHVKKIGAHLRGDGAVPSVAADREEIHREI